MGCAPSKETTSDGTTPRKKQLILTGEQYQGRGTMFVREVYDQDVHEAYDFTGPVLGSGAFATVLRVKDRMSGVEYAIKQIDLSGIKDDPSTMRMLSNEVNGMKAMEHPNIVRLQEVYMPEDEDMLYLVLDRLEGGSVDALRKQKGHVEEGLAAFIMAQVVDAVRYCHNKNIAHRDLKLANCVFEDKSPAPIVKVIDFGLCKELKDGQTSSAFVGTMTYAAPEVVMKNKRHGLECDLWSIGVMAYALVGGSVPFAAEDPGALQHQIKYIRQLYTNENWKGVSALCRDFIDKCLEKNPKKRITAKQAQSHPWIRKAVKEMDGPPLSKDAMLSLVKFQEKNLFEQVALELVAYSYEPSQIKELEQLFREMDKTGKGVVSLSDFKAVIMERRLSIVQKGQQQQQQQQQQQEQENEKTTPGAQVEPQAGPKPGGDADAAAVAAPTNGGETGSKDNPDTGRTAAAVASGEGVPPDRGGEAGEVGGSVEAGGPGGGTATPVVTPAAGAVKAGVAGARAAAATGAGGEEGVEVGALAWSNELPEGRQAATAAGGGTGEEKQQQQGGTAAPPAPPAAAAAGSLPPSSPSGRGRRNSKPTSSVSMEEVGAALVREVSDSNSGSNSKGASAAAADAPADAPAAATSATTPCPDGANASAEDLFPRPPLYRKQSSRTRAIGGLDEEGVERMFEAIDVDNSGTISITEFVAASLAKQQINSRSLKAAFNRLDHDRTGLITIADVSMYLGHSFDESMMGQNMREISSREDGLVSLEDFSKCLKKHVLKRERSSSGGSSRRVTTDSAFSGGRGTNTFDSDGRPNIT